MATRPLLLSLITELLEKLNQESEAVQSLLTLTKTLLSAGIKSASKTLQILSEEDSISGTLVAKVFNFFFLSRHREKH